MNVKVLQKLLSYSFELNVLVKWTNYRMIYRMNYRIRWRNRSITCQTTSWFTTLRSKKNSGHKFELNSIKHVSEVYESSWSKRLVCSYLGNLFLEGVKMTGWKSFWDKCSLYQNCCSWNQIQVTRTSLVYYSNLHKKWLQERNKYSFRDQVMK